MSLIEEENLCTSDRVLSISQQLADGCTAEDIWTTISKKPVAVQFSMLHSSVLDIHRMKHQHILQLAVLLQKHFTQPNWSDIFVQCHYSIYKQIVSVSMRITNALKEDTPDQLFPDTLQAWLFCQVIQSKHLPRETVFSLLNQFNSTKSIRNGMKGCWETLDESVYGLFTEYFAVCIPARVILFLHYPFHDVSFYDEEHFKAFINAVTCHSAAVDTAVFYDAFAVDILRINNKVLPFMAKRLCQCASCSHIIDMLFTLYSNTTYATTTSQSSQWRYTQYLIFILRCIPFSMHSARLSNGISIRIASPLKKVQEMALALMKQIEINMKQRRKDFDWNFSEDAITSELDLDEPVVDDEGKDHEINSETDTVPTEQPLISEDGTRAVVKPVHLLEWMELFDEYDRRTYEEVEMMMSIGVKLIEESRSYIEPYIEDILQTMLSVKNRFNQPKFEQHRMDIILELLRTPTRHGKSTYEYLLDSIEIDRVLVLDVMIRVGYQAIWIEPLSNCIVNWVYSNTFEQATVRALEYLKDYGTVSVIRDWFVLYTKCSLNDRVCAALLTAALELASHIPGNLMTWECSKILPAVMQRLVADRVNHPNKVIRMAADGLYSALGNITNCDDVSSLVHSPLLI